MKIIIRGLLKNKKYLFFSVSGLIISYTFFLLLFTYVRSELNYDTQIPGHGNIYRVTTKVSSNGSTVKETAKSQMPLGEALKAQIPEVVSYARLLDEETLFRYGDIKLGRQQTYWVDETFPEMFSIQMVEGNAVDALSKPFSGLISEEVAQKFFGNESPIGKILIENEGLKMEIKGVFKKPLYNSHFNFDYLLSYKTVIFYNGFQNNFDTDMFYTYIKLEPNTDLKEINQKLAQFADATYVTHHQKNQKVELKLQPVSSIHLESQLENELSQNNKLSFIVILSLLGLFTLFVSLLNFSGMVSSRYMNNQTTLLMNQIFGSPHKLFTTMSIEIFILCLAAVSFAMSFTLVLGDRIFNLLEVSLSAAQLQQTIGVAAALLLLCVLFCSLVSGAMLIGKLPKGGRINASSTRSLGNRQSSLVILQYSFSIFLIIFLTTTLKQIHFLKNTNPGYNKEQILAIHSPRTLIMNVERITKGDLFIGQLKQAGLAEEGSITSDLPGKPVHTDLSGFVWLSPTESPEVKVPADWISIDPGYFKTLGLKFSAGLNFEGERLANKDKIIINEKAAKAMGFENPAKAIGTTIDGNSPAFNQTGRKLLTIAGVVADFHQEGLQEEIKPTAFTYSYFYLFGCCALKLTSVNAGTISDIKKTWETIYPNDPFDYFFLDERFNQQYKSEVLFFRLCLVFGIIATLIACYGLFGISVETISKRRKEIGIRKVNGATIFEITGMLNGTYIRWIGISFIIASPFAYYVIHKWLESFAYKTELSWWIFALAGVLALGIALLTVSWQSWKAATRNPVEALRYE